MIKISTSSKDKNFIDSIEKGGELFQVSSTLSGVIIRFRRYLALLMDIKLAP